MLIVVSPEEIFDLFCQEAKQFLGGLGYHELMRYGYFGLSEGEGGVAVETYRANSEVGTA